MNSLYGNFRNFKFTDIWNNADDFVADYKDSGLYSNTNKISDANANTLYYLLYANYGNSVVASSDPTRFAYNVFAIIYESGPSWEKELEVQNKLRSLTDADLLSGAEQIVNHAYNPSQAPATNAFDALSYINEQSANKYKKGKVDGYALLLQLLKSDVTSIFISKFKKLFLTIVEPERPLWYVTNTEVEENDIG